MNRDAALTRIRGLYGIADAGASGGDPERLAAQLLAGGCRLLQLRCKGWALDTVEAAARAIVQRCKANHATLILNDHPELVGPVGAHGVHLGQLDVGTAAARRLLPATALIGRSTNDPEQLGAALADADYVAFGPVFSTANAGRPKTVRGLDALAVARHIVPRDVPLVAIGGIDQDRLPAVRATGVDAWAVIGAIASAPDPLAATAAFLA